MRLETFGEVINNLISSCTPSSWLCCTLTCLLAPWTATRTLSSEHTVRHAGSLTLCSSVVSLWSQRSKCSSRKKCPLIPCQVREMQRRKCISVILLFSCILIHQFPFYVAVISLISLASLVHFLSPSLALSISICLAVCVFIFLLMYALEYTRCAIRGDNHDDCYCRSTEDASSAICQCWREYSKLEELLLHQLPHFRNTAVKAQNAGECCILLT